MFRFNLLKTIQATTFLIQQPGKDHKAYLKLIKLLYLAERESLLETGHPFTGDKTWAMPHGPALGTTCALMNGTEKNDLWDMHLKGFGNHELEIVADPGTDHLCKYECDKLEEVARQYADKDRWQTRDATHNLPEWKKNDPGDSRKLIKVKDILETGGKRKVKMLRHIMEEAKAEKKFWETMGA